jgi:choline dehydrogenase-like flavoprotein
MRASSNTKPPFDKRSHVRVYSDKDRKVPWRRPDRSLVEAPKSTLPKLAANLEPQYDFIVRRSGSSGSVVARRLAEHPNVVPTVMDSGHRTLKVYGVESLRIADGSIMLRVTTVNTLAPYVVTGERDADILRTEHRLSVDAEVNK